MPEGRVKPLIELASAAVSDKLEADLFVGERQEKLFNEATSASFRSNMAKNSKPDPKASG